MKKDKLNYHAIINGNELEDIDELVSITFENKDGTKWTFLPQELTEIKVKVKGNEDYAPMKKYDQ